MQTNLMASDAGGSKAQLVMALILSAVGIMSVMILIGHGPDGVAAGLAQRTNNSDKIILAAQEGRPLAHVILMLEAQYGWIITYEDPRYAYADDIRDATEKGNAVKTLVPKGGKLTFEYDKRAKDLPLDPAVVVRQLLIAQARSGIAGQFRMEQDGRDIHVIPTAVKDASGRLRPNKSVLDAPITVAEKERNGLQTLEAFCAAVGKVTHMRVMVGTIPLNLFYRRKFQLGATRQVARAVLVHLLEETGNGTRLSWRLLYDPGDKIYMLNIRVI
jgi:hypothetical protein